MDQENANQNLAVLDTVALTCDLPGLGLRRGQVGTIVYTHDPSTFEVEFVDPEGRTYALTTLKSNQFLKLRYRPPHAA